ncbi:MAG: MmpS family transport accessory protein [Streptomyces sp.]
MSHSQPPPYQPPAADPAPAPQMRPKWARKRIAIPAAAVIMLVGVGIGAAGGEDQKKTSTDAKPQPTVTVTKTAEAREAKAKRKPQPTKTVTKTPKPKATKKPAEDKAPEGKVVFKVWGSASSGVDINYGSDSDSRQGSGLPMTKTLTLDSEALYYNVSAQLSGGGDINCSVTVNGRTKKGHASGGYNICSAQLNGGITGGWE